MTSFLLILAGYALGYLGGLFDSYLLIAVAAVLVGSGLARMVCHHFEARDRLEREARRGLL